MHRGKRSRGFTLIELLVVIAIIAILAAILFPVFARARLQAVKNNCINNLKQITAAVNMYTGDYHDKFPFVSGFGPNLDNKTEFAQLGGAPGNLRAVLGGNNNADYQWFQHLLLPYIKNQGVFICGGVKQDGVWYLPSTGNKPMQFHFNNKAGADDNDGNNPPVITPDDPITTYVFNAFCLDGVWQQNGAFQSNGSRRYISGQSMAVAERVAEAPLIWDGMAGYVVPGAQEAQFPHGDSLVVAYADGHVRAFQVPNTSDAQWMNNSFWSVGWSINRPESSRGWCPQM